MNPVIRQVVIRNKKGLHARAAAKFVKTAEQFDAKVTVTRMIGGANDPQPPTEPEWSVNARSILGLMMLGAEPGTVLQLACEGAQARDAADALQALVDGLFDEGE